jgi:tetratricopeptide (TPR) repeat protein
MSHSEGSPDNAGGAHISPGRLWRRFALASALVGMVLLAYIPTLAAGWVWDDDAHVTHNQTLRSLDGLGRIWLEPGATPQYYPLVFSTFWIEYRFWGIEARPYHVTNVLLHGLNAGLLWYILSRLRVPAAWLAAALFALHPVHVESVAWVTERKNVLSGVFYLAALLAYLHFVSNRTWWCYGAALALFLAALLSKTVTCTLPVVLLVLIWWQHGRLRRLDILCLVPCFVVGAGFGILTIWMEKHFVGADGTVWSLSAGQRCAIAGTALLFYAGKLAWPMPLIFIYPRWEVDLSAAAWYLPTAIVLGVLAGLWLARHRLGLGPLVAVLLFTGTLFPALGFFDVYPFRYSFVADHFQYLASVPLLALAATIGAAVLRGRRLAPLGAIVLLLVLAILTCRRSCDYRSEQILWQDTLAKHPDCSLAHARLGLLLADQRRYGQAVAHFHEVVRLNPDSAADRLRLANLAALAGRFEEAIAAYRTVSVMSADLQPLATIGLAKCLGRLGRFNEAAQEVEAALRRHADNALLHCLLGVIRAEQGQFDQALEHVQTAQRLDPANQGVNRVLEAIRQGRPR